MQVICLEETAFYSLVEQVVARQKETHNKAKDKVVFLIDMSIVNNVQVP